MKKLYHVEITRCGDLIVSGSETGDSPISAFRSFLRDVCVSAPLRSRGVSPFDFHRNCKADQFAHGARVWSSVDRLFNAVVREA